jgi:hypothetical protein
MLQKEKKWINPKQIKDFIETLLHQVKKVPI